MGAWVLYGSDPNFDRLLPPRSVPVPSVMTERGPSTLLRPTGASLSRGGSTVGQRSWDWCFTSWGFLVRFVGWGKGGESQLTMEGESERLDGRRS